jgi:nucleoside-diphosphate-sugar epimerase
MTRLIVGCGYLGQRVARRWLAASERVLAVTRSPERAESLRSQGLEPLVADVTRPETLGRLPEAQTVLYAVGHDPRSGLSRHEVYAQGLRNVLDALPGSTGRIVFTSSTGIYGDAHGDWVDEDSPCQPNRESGRAMLAGEEVLRSHPLGSRGIVLRLAGLYGPGRITRLGDLLAGRPITASATGYVNLIHVDDAAEVVLAAAALAPVPRTYVVSDGQPVTRQEFYDYLATLLGRDRPSFVDPTPEARAASRSSGEKRLRNRRMLDELGVKLTYPSYREGLAAVMHGL